MIVTRSWLEKYIDLDGVSNDDLYEAFNRIGLEVDSIIEHKIPKKIVVGRIVACGKHPDADKLSLCQIDIGDGEPKQIICGAANVVDAEYVAVATVGAVLPDGMEIKPAKLRGVESFGMVCSSTELGLPKINDGIMILDESIGELEVGRELGTYPRIADTVIELELTANRGDCLSIYGVACDLSAAFDRPIKSPGADRADISKSGIARKLEVHSEKDLPVDLIYFLAENDGLQEKLTMTLRLAFVDLESKGRLDNIIKYSSHATGVMLHAYDAQKLKDEDGKISLNIIQKSHGQVAVAHEDKAISIVGVARNGDFAADDDAQEVLFEASYMNPDLLVEAVSTQKLKTDPFYYNTSRGSEPDLKLGMTYLQNICGCAGKCKFYEGDVSVRAKHQERSVNVSVKEISAIIGNPVSKTNIYTILGRLGLDVHGGDGETFGVRIPQRRHDIVNLQDVTEEVLRMIGIDSIEAIALKVPEQNRLTNATKLFHVKRDLRQRAVSVGFYESVTYAFTDRNRLEAYGFLVTLEELELTNPIVEELNTLRSTLMTNLLDAMKRNVSYGIKRIPLFEIGPVFDAHRNQSDKIAFVWSGQTEVESVSNHGKPSSIDFATFVDNISRIIGDIELVPCEEQNRLIHPYQSATVVRNGVSIGYITKLHPTVAKEYDLGETFVAEMNLEPLLPEHVLVEPVSNYQGVYKDISVLVDKSVPYGKLNDAIVYLNLPLLKRHYVIDVYEDDTLGDSKSVTIRLFVQSDKGTLSESEIEESVNAVLEALEDQCQATLR
jgi:phenylalanyl-tRNA synthetase beta chain